MKEGIRYCHDKATRSGLICAASVLASFTSNEHTVYSLLCLSTASFHFLDAARNLGIVYVYVRRRRYAQDHFAVPIDEEI